MQRLLLFSSARPERMRPPMQSHPARAKTAPTTIEPAVVARVTVLVSARALCNPFSGVVRRELDILLDDAAEGFSGMDRFEAAVKVHGSSDVSMSQESTNGFVFSRPVLEKDCCCGVPELVRGDVQTRRLADPITNLNAQ